MPNLSDLQLVLLTAAAQRSGGNVLPPPDSVAGQRLRIRKAIPPLLKRALVAEVDANDSAQSWREEGEHRIGVMITDAGREAIGVGDPEAGAAPAASAPIDPARDPAPDAQKPLTKSAQVVALLQRGQGATLAELIEATGWLPHTTRAALTGLRKRGHALAKSKRNEVTCYSIGVAA